MGIKEQIEQLRTLAKLLDTSRFLDENDKKTVRKMKQILNSETMNIEYINMRQYLS